MRLSLYSSAGWRHPLGLSYVIALAQRTGFHEVSIRGRSTESLAPSEQQIRAIGYDMLSMEESSADGMAELSELFRSQGIAPYCLSTYASLVDPDPSVRQNGIERIRGALEFAARYGVPVIRTIGHVIRDQGVARTKVGDTFIEGLEALVPACESTGVPLQIENAESSYPQTAAEINRVVDAVGSAWCSVAYDPVNAYFCGLEPGEELDALARAPDAIHVKDVTAVDGEYRWTPVGEGSLGWPELLKRARSKGFDGRFVCEYVNPHKLSSFHGWEELSPPEEWAHACATFVRSHWGGT